MTKPILLCLHGWGGSKESFTELRDALRGTNIEILTPDLPGFGREAEPKTAWTTDDYANWAEQWMHSQFPARTSSGSDDSIFNSPLYVLGHSHGGRIAVKLAINSDLPITHLFLAAPAGIKHPRHIKRMIGLTLSKTGKFFLSIPGLRSLAPIAKKFLYRLVRVHDYENLSPVMKQTMINVTKEDFRPLLSKVDVPTDIFWGTEDGMTPYSDAKIYHEGIKGSELHTYEGIRHRIHRDKAKEIALVIKHVI